MLLLLMLSSPTAASRTLLLELPLLGHSLHVLLGHSLHVFSSATAASRTLVLELLLLGHECGVCLWHIEWNQEKIQTLSICILVQHLQPDNLLVHSAVKPAQGLFEQVLQIGPHNQSGVRIRIIRACVPAC